MNAADMARQARRLSFWARIVLVPVAVIGAVLSYQSLYTAAQPTFGPRLAAGFPLLVDLLILGASLQYVAGAKVGRPMTGWRLTAHCGVAATLALNALAARELGEVPWHITAPAVWAVLVELTGKQVLGQWKAVHHGPAASIAPSLWVSAPIESLRARLLMARTGLADSHQARMGVGTAAAAREALTLSLPRRVNPRKDARRVRRVVNRQLRAGSLPPSAVLDAVGWIGDAQPSKRSPESILRSVVHSILRPAGEEAPEPWTAPATATVRAGMPAEAFSGPPAGMPAGMPAGTPVGTPGGIPFGAPGHRPAETFAGAPGGTPAGAPGQTPAGTFAGTPAGTFAGTQAGTPAGAPGRTPAETFAGTPARTFAGTPAGTPAGSPGRTPAETFAGTSAGTSAGPPAETFAGTPAGNDGRTPAGTFAGTPVGPSAAGPGRSPAQTFAGTPTGSPADPQGSAWAEAAGDSPEATHPAAFAQRVAASAPLPQPDRQYAQYPGQPDSPYAQYPAEADPRYAQYAPEPDSQYAQQAPPPMAEREAAIERAAAHLAAAQARAAAQYRVPTPYTAANYPTAPANSAESEAEADSRAEYQAEPVTQPAATGARMSYAERGAATPHTTDTQRLSYAERLALTHPQAGESGATGATYASSTDVDRGNPGRGDLDRGTLGHGDLDRDDLNRDDPDRSPRDQHTEIDLTGNGAAPAATTPLPADTSAGWAEPVGPDDLGEIADDEDDFDGFDEYTVSRRPGSARGNGSRPTPSEKQERLALAVRIVRDRPQITGAEMQAELASEGWITSTRTATRVLGEARTAPSLRAVAEA